MGNPSIVVHTYSDSPTGHANVSFYDSDGNWVATIGSNIGVSSLPGEMGGVYNENPMRIASYSQTIIFTDPAKSAWTNALNYAQNAVSMTAGGAGEYFLLGNNCYDFVDNVMVQAGYPNNSAYKFMEPGSLVATYGEVQHDMLNIFSILHQTFIDSPEAAYAYYPKVAMYNQFISVNGGFSHYDEEGWTVQSNVQRLETKTWLSPLAIDLTGDGFDIINLNNSSAKFDFYADGRMLNTAWLTGTDAFLVHDMNNDGLITDMTEMFGGPGYGDGFSKLSKYDSNGDNIINHQDKKWHSLQLWLDSNADGVSFGELYSLDELGVTSLSLASFKSNERIGDGYVAETSFAEVNGKKVDFADIFFRQAGVVSAEQINNSADMPYERRVDTPYFENEALSEGWPISKTLGNEYVKRKYNSYTYDSIEFAIENSDIMSSIQYSEIIL